MRDFNKTLFLFTASLSLALALACTVSASTAHAAAYIKFDGVDGESKDKDHKDWINLASFSQAIQMPGGSATGATRRRGSAVLENIVLTKELDKSSTKLAEALLTGKVFPTVIIHLTASYTDAGRVTYYAYELKNVSVTSYKVSGSGQAENVPTEEIAISFEEIKVTYKQFDSRGRKKGAVEYSWKVGK